MGSEPAPRGTGAALLISALAAGALLAAGPSPTWIDLDEDQSYTARHECSFVQAGDRFFLFGGRENAQTLEVYDYTGDSWSTGASVPVEFNHFQATEHEGLVWVIGAFSTNNFPNETPAESIYVYDPAHDVWMEGPQIPAARRRGSTGLVVHDGKFYVACGNTIGHNGGYVAWFDEYDPRVGAWAALPDAPGARDHFHAAVVGDKLYALGGRLSGGDGGTFAPLVAEVDVYDFAGGSWTRLPGSADLPTPRAASAVALFGGEILVIGGEGGGQAYADVHGFDPVSETWSPRASLNHARHGTQAIVSGNGVYVAAGSPNQGGGNQRNMEVYDSHAPSGSPSVAGVLSAPAAATVPAAAPATLVLAHAGGNQGVFVTEVVLSGPDAGDFGLITDVASPFLIPVAGDRALAIEYSGAVDGASASLDLTHSGGESLSVALTGTLSPGAPGVVGGLAVGKSGGDVLLTWDADCGAGDAFGVYRGDLALGYDSLAPATCDVATNAATIPMGLPDGEFFLVAPVVGTAEGGFGRREPCAPRPAPFTRCHGGGRADDCVLPCPP